MVRSIPADRFRKLIEVATRAFVTRGYQRTQMGDVAAELDVAKGTLYGYVESKAALFDAAVRFADDPPGAAPSPLPLPTPLAGGTVRYVCERLKAETSELELATALSRPKRSRVKGDEFESIVRDLYERMAKNRNALKMVDRCAIDHPELAAVWFEHGRWRQVALLATYLERRISEGRMRAVPNVQLAARMVLETIALWTIHMPWDPSPRQFPEDDVAAGVIDMLGHAYAKRRA